MLIKISEEPEKVVETPWEYWCMPAVAEEYDARRFHHLKGYLYRQREERAIELALRGLPPGSRVLDAACGTGRITALLRRNGYRATGCDISRAMIDVARRRLASVGGHEVPFVENNVEHLPYEDKSFDAVTCAGLLMHFDADRRVRVLCELARVGRGRIVVQYGCLSPLLRLKARVSGRPPGNVQHPVSDGEMRTDFARSGLRERARFWILRGLSSSLIVLLTE